MSKPYDGQSTTQNVPGVSGTNTAGGDGVFGKGWRGVVGDSETYQGVFGHSRDNAGVVGESDNLHGVYGTCHNPHGAGVFGTNDKVGGFGVQGINESGDGVIGTGRRGVVGISETYQGVYGKSGDNSGVVGESDRMHAVFAITHSPTSAGVFATNTQGGLAGYFDGNVTCTGTHNAFDFCCSGKDCAEEFEIANAAEIEPGMVMVLDQEGVLQPSQQAYDKRVAGVISGAGDYKPGIVLGKQQPSEHRAPIALAGKVYCKVDAQYGSVEVGDLLTTSDTPGHAMKADDSLKAFGAVIGKALRPLKEGQCLVPILIALQ